MSAAVAGRHESKCAGRKRGGVRQCSGMSPELGAGLLNGEARGASRAQPAQTGSPELASIAWGLIGECHGASMRPRWLSGASGELE
jgi:hypothetical protein